jgi:hypothetical protein
VAAETATELVEANVGVTHERRQRLDVDAGGDHQRRVAVAALVQRRRLHLLVDRGLPPTLVGVADSDEEPDPVLPPVARQRLQPRHVTGDLLVVVDLLCASSLRVQQPGDASSEARAALRNGKAVRVELERARAVQAAAPGALRLLL